MTSFSNKMLFGSFSLFLTLAVGSLYGALPQLSEPTSSGLKRSKNFDIKNSGEHELNDIIASARFEKNTTMLGYLLYEYGWDSECIKNLSTELIQNNVPPQNVFVIMQAYTGRIDDKTLQPIILSSFIAWLLQQSVIAGNVGYIAYFLTDPICKKLILIEDIEQALKNLSFCQDDCNRKPIENLLRGYLEEHFKVVLNFCLLLIPAAE